MARIVKYKDRFYDTGTSNTSFLQLSKDLKTLGVKNYFFMLEIFDHGLVNVDPYAVDKDGKPALTRDQISRIIVECKRNPWYYLREICRIPEQGNANGVPYRANRGNIAQAWCILHGLDSWLCIPRQQGKTQSALALELWIYHFGTSNSSFIFVNKDGENAKANLRRVGDQIDLLPEYLKFKYIMDEDGKVTKARENATMYLHPVTKNNILVKPKATSYDNAMSLARGLTAPILHFDEPEFTPYIDIIVENSASTFGTAHRNSIANGAISARIFTCTPGDLGTKPAMAAQNILDKTIKWTESFYDRKVSDIIALMNKNRSNKIIYIEYQYYQIGLTNEWLRDESDRIGNPLTVRREILLQRIHGSDLSPYPREDIEYIGETMSKPISTLFVGSYYEFDIYEELQRNIPYIVGVDCSTGTSSDNNAITIINPYTVRPVAEFKSPYIGETEYEGLLISLVTEHIPRAIVVIERNSVGDGIIDHLLNSRIAHRLYFDKNRDLMAEKMRQSETVESMLSHKAKIKTFYGVYTSGKSREDMFSILSRRVNENKDDFVTQNIIKDITGLVRTSSGKIEAGPGLHDDSVMSYLIALYIYYHGNNLAAFGFYRTDIYDGSELNQGINRPAIEELLPSEVIEGMKQQESADAVMNYEDIYREAMEEAQRSSMALSRSKIMRSDNVFDNTNKELLNTTYNDDDYGDLSLDIFSTLNGF